MQTKNTIQFGIDEIKSYEETMSIENDKQAKLFNKIIERIGTKLFKKLIKKYQVPFMWAGIAETNSAINSNVTVKINREEGSITIINKTGESIVIGDKVYLISPSGNLSNSYAITKF